MQKPICVWENKAPTELAAAALAEAEFYIEGLRKALPNEPALPLIAVGYNGAELKASLYTNDGKWAIVTSDGAELRDAFPKAEYISAGITSEGIFTARNGSATAQDLRTLLPKLKTLYRNIATLASGRTPIDFTVAILTLKLIVEQNPDWGTWSELPRFAPAAKTIDQAIGEKLETFAKRVLTEYSLKTKYADIFEFHEKSDTLEIAFSFSEILETIEKGKNNFVRLFELLDGLPPLTGADFDIFGEVYQAIGDEATKKKLGEFFTGRHIIAGVLPILFSRATFDKSFSTIRNKKVADLACGTGGFLTETLRLVKQLHKLSDATVRSFAQKAFFGYDLGHANASRARVNMYFAGDGFSIIKGGIDSLSTNSLKLFPKGGFDVIETNPPYGTSNYGRIEEAFLLRILESLKPGTGWALVVLPTGILENPRAARIRFDLLNQAIITDVIALPKHAFAPYTQQRTAIVIFQKRKSSLVEKNADWQKLLKSTGHEKINMFIVDNDGYANSDKRYPTDKTDQNGQWLHNDLLPWVDKSGIKHPSKLFHAMVEAKPPVAAVNEEGTPLGPKYGVFEPAELAQEGRGIALLPDIPLRAELRTIPISEWLERVDNVLEFSRGQGITLPLPFKEEVEFLLDHGLRIPKKALNKETSVADLLEVTKGDQGLTEAMIYRHLKPNGIPVYGGGGSAPRFQVDYSLKRNTGTPATLFNGPALVVSMDGSSGKIQVIESGKFYCNHHGAVLKPKKDFSLWCFAQVAEPSLRRLASNKGGSATLTKPALERFRLRLPTGTPSSEIEARRRELTRLARMLS